MKQQYHIVNGDSLKAQFPQQLPGEILVARECLSDGDVQGKDLDELFTTRARFIRSAYEGGEEKDYYQWVVPEFRKMLEIPEAAEINLWFEDDLFCQVNLWFVISLLHMHKGDRAIFLVRPKSGSEYCFGHMSESELVQAYHTRRKMEPSEARGFGNLWGFYQSSDYDKMLQTARGLDEKYPFLTPAIEANVDRVPKDGEPGRPIRSLISIVEELGTTEFEPIYREFSKRESIYGFGDAQVKRLLSEIGRNR